MRIEIDKKSGFCFGVTHAIEAAEKALGGDNQLYCLGDIVHNHAEIERLKAKGMITITREQFFTMRNCRVLIRAHGEPPETYRYAEANRIELIDATCPVVLKLQKRVKASFEEAMQSNAQVVIFGKPGHAELEGLNGQTGYKAIVVENRDDIGRIDFNRPVVLYSQTTKPVSGFQEIAGLIREKAAGRVPVVVKDTICRQVSNRAPHLAKFAAEFDVIVFVSGRKSSNGAALHAVCQSVNPRSHFVSEPGEIRKEWFYDAASAGICGATSTPMWLMEKVAETIQSLS